MRKKACERPNKQVSHLQEIARPDLRGVVAQKRAPLLPSWRLCANVPHVLLNGAFAHMNAPFQEFTPYAFSTEDGDCSSPSRLLKAIVSAAIFGL
jgi:hypothetical protein